MKEKAAKIIFVLTIAVPWGIVLCSGVYGLIFGATGLFGSELSGWDACYSNLFWTTLMLVIIPVIPLCLVYDIAYLLRRFAKPVREMPLSRYIIIVVCIVAVLAAVVLAVIFRGEIGDVIDKHRAQAMLGKAEDKIEYNLNHFNADGIFGIDGCIHDSVLIDHDRMEIGILYDASLDEYRQYRLTEASPNNDDIKRITEAYFVNAVFPLSSPLKRLISFYPEDESYSHRTIAFIVETEDGRVYYADDLCNDGGAGTEYFGFRGSEYYVSGNVRYDALP